MTKEEITEQMTEALRIAKISLERMVGDTMYTQNLTSVAIVATKIFDALNQSSTSN